MSRVHDALRKAAQENPQAERVNPTRSTRYPIGETFDPNPGQPGRAAGTLDGTAPVAAASPEAMTSTEACIQNARRVEFHPLSDALLVNPAKPRQAPAEEFRTLRTRLNHLQSIQPLRTLVVTSASPAEGKSFTAANLAITQAQLADKRVLLADFDFRRPTVDKTFQVPVSPGMTNYLQGTASLSDVMTRVGDSNLYLITAGDPVPNPLELLNLKECGTLIEDLRSHFDWVILDSPPLLFAADGNLLATMCDGTVLVVRIGTTTFDSVTRALQSLCENNVLGIVVNGARRGELYSKYSYYHDYYEYGSDERPEDQRVHEEEEADHALAD
ncbi:MAG TPA: CpsD/CapB family tyrosine-protein kinase [Bryobacteraceae bacterium]|nr:CpsD/CapB family tyrosine-protein kinase [Bryobacteraceae bacterium]